GTVFSGSLDEVALFAAALDPAEIQGLMRDPLPRPAATSPSGQLPIASILDRLILPTAYEGTAYQASLSGAFCGTPVRHLVFSGSLPPGLELSADGVIAGTPLALGDFDVKIRATDADGNSADLAVQLSVQPAPPAFTREPEDQRVQAGGLLVLVAETSRPASIQWFFNGKPITGQTRSLLSIQDFAVNQSGVYQAVAENAGGTRWSREATVTLQTTPPADNLDPVAPIDLQPDGLVRLRIPTLRGHLYEIQRALDLTAAIEGRWTRVLRFVAPSEVAELADYIPTRPDAAFYRVIEIGLEPAAPFSLEDTTRFAGLGDDGVARKGLLPAVDPVTGRLSAFEFRPHGDELPADHGLLLRFPEGAQPISRDGGTLLQFRRLELSFAEDSPIQFDERGQRVLDLSFPADRELTVGSISVVVLESLLGKSAGSGVDVLLFERFAMNLRRGTFAGPQLRGAQLAWRDPDDLPLPMPIATGDYPDFDLDLTGRSLRFPFHGEFRLTDATRSPVTLRIQEDRPAWIEFRAGHQIAARGVAEVRVTGGPTFIADFDAEPPAFRLALRARGLRLPAGMALTDLLPNFPRRPSLTSRAPMTPPDGGFRSEREWLEAFEAAMKQADEEMKKASWATDANYADIDVTKLPENLPPPAPAPVTEATAEVRPAFRNRDFRETDPVGALLGTLPLWRAFVDNREGLLNLTAAQQATVHRVVQKRVAQVQENFGETGNPNDPLTFELRARLLDHVVAIAVQAAEDDSILNSAARNAYDLFRQLEDATDCGAWKPDALLRAVKAINNIRSNIGRRPDVLPDFAGRDLNDWSMMLVRCRGERLQAELGVRSGEDRPDNNPKILKLHRFEAAQRLVEAADILRSGQAVGIAAPTVRPEVISQLVLRIWQDLRGKILQAGRGCDFGTWNYLLPEIGEIIASYAQYLASTPDGIALVTPVIREALSLTQIPVAFGECFRNESASAAEQLEQIRISATDRTLAQRFLLPGLRTLRQLVRDVPSSISIPLPAVDLHLDAVRLRFDAVLAQSNLGLWASANNVTVEDVGDILETAMLHDQLRIRFHPETPHLLLTEQRLPRIVELVHHAARRDTETQDLQRIAQILLDAIRTESSLETPSAARVLSIPPSPQVAAWREAVRSQVETTGSLLHDLYATRLRRAEALSLADLLVLSDIRLPGGLTVEEAWGEVSVDLAQRRFAGAFGGDLRLPGLGLALQLRHAALRSDGDFDAEISGSLAVPAVNPVATLSIPAEQPVRLRVRQGHTSLSGAARLRWPQGSEVDCFLSLDDPIYQFSASARGLRLQWARDLTGSIGLPVLDRLPTGTHPQALDLLTRSGLILEGTAPDSTTHDPDDLGVSRAEPNLRPTASPTDDLVAATRALDLLIRRPDALAVVRNAAAPHATPASPAPAASRESNAVAHLVTQIDRASRQLSRDTEELSQLDLALLGDSVSVPPAELAQLRGPKLLLVAQNLGAFGGDFLTTRQLLSEETVRQRVSATGIDLEASTRSYFQNFGACLGALRTNLLVLQEAPTRRWVRGPYWDPAAARATWQAALRFIELLQLTGGDVAALTTIAQDLHCDLGGAFLEQQLQNTGLDPGTGNIPSSSDLRATYDRLSADSALEAARQILELEVLAQQAAWCAPDPRRQSAIAALVLRARNAQVATLRRIETRTSTTAWERPEAILAAATNLLDAVLIPARLGMLVYPESAPRLRADALPADTLNPATDVADLVQVIRTATSELIQLHDNAGSGYRAELDRRALALRRIPLPAAGNAASVAALFANIPDLTAFRTQLSRLAAAEADALVNAATRNTALSKLNTHARDFARRVIELGRLLDTSTASTRTVHSSPRLHADPARDRLIAEFLPRLVAAVSEPGVPWWVSASVAQEFLAASTSPDLDAAFRTAMESESSRHTVLLRDQVARLQARLSSVLETFDFALPGNLEIRRLFGEVAFNRETHFLSVALGGRLEFPGVPTGSSQVAFIDLDRLRLESNGRFSLVASARTPLPLPNASFTGQVSASGDWPHRALSLAGRGTLTFVTPPTNPESGQPFDSSISAGLAYEPVGFLADGTPVGWRFRITADGQFRRSFGKHLAVFGAAAGLVAGQDANGNPFGAVSVGGSAGMIRKSSRLNVEPPAPEDFELIIENAGVEIAGAPDAGGYAALTNGTLRLPGIFYPATLPPDLRCSNPTAAATGARIVIRDPIKLSYTVGERPRLDGVLRFSQFGLRLPRADFLSFVVCEADLGIDDAGFPFLDVARAGMQLDLPWDKGIFRIQNLHLALDGQIQGQFLLAEDFDLVNAGGLRLTLPAASSVNAAPNLPPTGCRGTALVLEDVPGFDAPRIRLTSGVRVEFPLSVLTTSQGDRVAGLFCGGISVEPTDNGPAVRAFVDELALQGDFKLGAKGPALRRAHIAAADFEGILQPNPEQPFRFTIGADLEAGPFTFGVTNVQLRYLGTDRLPAFSIQGIEFARDATKPLPPPLAFLPFAIDAAALRFKDSLAPLSDLVKPTNIIITVAGRVGFPSVTKAFVRGGVNGLEFSFDPDGNIVAPAIDGFELALSTGAELKLPAFGDLGGKFRVGGLRRAATDGPSHIYAVGEIGGTQAGNRLNLLGALSLAGPIGFCLDVNFGAAGIVLAPTPFQITGASGGLALLTTDNPCDFTQYFDFDSASGTYRLRQTIELPNIPIGMSWPQFTQTLEDVTRRLDQFAGRFQIGDIPLPSAAAGAHADFTPTAHSNLPIQVLNPQELDPASANTRGLARLSDPADVQRPHDASLQTQPAAFGCPRDCPPRTVAILCQPHPDQTRFPDRVIFKFSSIAEDRLTNAPPNGLGLDRDAVRRLGSDSPTIARAVAERLVTALGNPSLPIDLPPQAATFVAEQERLALEGVRTIVQTLVEQALRRSPDAYAAIRDELYKGAPCPDLSLALAGRMSIVGISAFGFVEGRETTSFSGSGGVVGELHMLGIPMGQARAFLSTTDAQGLPNPSVCGQVTAGLGPFEFGRVDLAMRCDGCVTELLRLIPTLAQNLGQPLLRGALDRLAPEYAALASDPAAFLRQLRTLSPNDQLRIMIGLLSEVQNADPDSIPGNLGDLARDALADTWSRINPQLVLCGDITPRLMGLPLTLGGRGVALNALGDKTGTIGEFAFAPSSFIPIFPPGDEATMSFSLRVQDPYMALIKSFDGTFNRPETTLAFVREQAESALQNMIIAAQYEWHPFGLELGDAAIRVVTPDLLDHPAFPNRRWTNPDERGSDGLPTRDDVLVQAAASGKLGRAFEWVGSTNDLADIFDSQDPRGIAIRARQLDLRKDYFPHGGILGGARMALPRMLMVATADWLPLYDRAVHGTNLFEQFEAAMALLNDYVLRTETNGTAAFYVPAPNPPLLYDARGQRLSANDLRRAMALNPDAFSPDGLMRQIRGLDFSAPQSLAHLYPDNLSFLRAEMTNLTILGVPVFGTATITGRPTPVRLLDGTPMARLEFDIAGNSPVGRLAGGGFRLGFDLYATPDRSLAVWARELRDELQRQRPSSQNRALAGMSPQSLPPALRRIEVELARQLPRFATTNVLPEITISDPRDWAGSGASDLPDLPASIRGPSRTPKSPPLLRAHLNLHAFSPFYDPASLGDGPVVGARRDGGLAVSGRVELLPGTALQAGAGWLEASVTASGNQPRLRGRIRELNLPTPFPGIALRNGQADFDNQANPFLNASVRLPSIAIGTLFQLIPANREPDVAASITLGTTSRTPRILSPSFGMSLSPLRLQGPRLGGKALIVHGSSGLASNCVVTESRWDARATLSTASAQTHLNNPDLVLRAELASAVRDVLHVTGLPASPFAFEGESLDRFTLRLTTPTSEPLTVELFPGLNLAGMPDKVLRLNPVSGNTIDFTVSSDGTFLLVAKLAQSLNLGAAGVFAAGAEVRLDQTGASISGQIANASGTLVVGAVNNQITATLSGSLVLPRIVALGGRVILASPQGGDLTATTGPEGTCVSGAELTLQNFAPNTTPLRISFPAFCLDANRTFRDLSPAAAEATPAGDFSLKAVRLSSSQGNHRLASTMPASALRRLPAGAFQLDNLGSLRLTGDFNARTLSLGFDSQLNLGSLLSLPIRGSVGTSGLRFSNTTTSLRLLGHDFSAIRLGITNTLGDLPAVSFAGRLANLPSPLNTLELGGLIPGAGDFTLTPPASVSLPSMIPSFPLNDALPSFAYRTAPYTDVVRSDLPSGFWPLEDIDDKVEDQRLASFSTSTPRRNGIRLGTRLPSQPGALADATRRSMAFDGSTSWVRWSQPELTPTPDGFTASLWFKRAAGRTGVPILTSPQTLLGRANQWSLRLQGTTTTGTRLHWAIDGLQTPSGSPLPALTSRTRIDDAEWHIVVAVYDGAAQYLYLDGRLDAWQIGQGTISTPATADTSLAARSDGNRVTEFFAGFLDEVAFYPVGLSPLDAQSHWLAAGNRGGLFLGGVLPANLVPGLNASPLEGILTSDGAIALRLTTPATPQFGGLRLPSFQGNLVRSDNLAALAFRSSLSLPNLDPSPIGTARGTLGSDGQISLQAASFIDRGVFGWDLRLTNLTVAGQWIQRQATASLGGHLRLPYNLATLEVGGDANPAAGTFDLRGRAAGGFNIGTRPFNFSTAPEFTRNLFKLPGSLALGSQADAARFSTQLEVQRSGGISATMGGNTSWLSFPGNIHGQLQWSGQLGFVSGNPQLAFSGTLGLAWPNQPASLDLLQHGLHDVYRRECWQNRLGFEFCTDVLDGLTLKTNTPSLQPNHRGQLSIQVQPAFQNQSFFDFRIP
ncbi:MAG: hypothetical protein JNK85_14750, partial [Verrucomicrobiales bacterium]|nr:hypothetical protein [Verrucomicrobiales bacterium]